MKLQSKTENKALFLSRNKGSYIVFLTIILSSIMIFVIFVITASSQHAISSTMENFGRLWGNSILAEYDRILFDRYGLFAFYGNEYETSEKIDYYAEGTIGEKKYIKYEKATVSLEPYSLVNTEVFEKQLEQAVIYHNKPVQVKPSGEDNVSENGAQLKSQSHVSDENNRRITASWILDGLPSKGSGDSFSIEGVISSIKAGLSLDNLIDNTVENKYMFSYFRNYSSKDILEDTFFNNEIEYILSGKADDYKARKNVYNKLMLIRNALNLAYLYSSKEKCEAVMAIAEVLTPGPAAMVMQAAILESWAFMESKNDLELLYDNKPVALLKHDCNFALTLENVLEQEFGVNSSGGTIEKDKNGKEKPVDYIVPEKVEGISYEDYLKILASFLPERTKLLRMMDLIQINLKYTYCDYFLIKDYYTGLQFSFTVNGIKHEFEEKY